MSNEIHRGCILHFPHATATPDQHYQYWEDGVLVVRNGLIQHVGDAAEFFAEPSNQQREHDGSVLHHQGLLLPGFIDSHVHFPQIEMIASYGKQLLDWLNLYAYPAELRFANPAYAQAQAEFFLQQLFSHGTTTAGVYATIHPASAEAFFSASERVNARMICGKVLMDRNCPGELRDTPDLGYHESKALIERWHKNGRQLYAITPRFAPTSTPQQLRKAGQLAKEHPDTFIQTHLSESDDEIAWVKTLFPDSPDYLDVYQHFGLVRERALFGHAIHLHPREYQALSVSGAAVSFCPSSNLFLGSGLFPYFRTKDANIPVALGSDIGAGTSLSLLRNLSDAYKVCQLQAASLNPFEAIYLCTQGAAVAMRLENKIGNLNPGTEADFICLDFDAFPILSYRIQRCKNLAERLFALITIGDERTIKKTYVYGKLIYEKESQIRI